MERELWESVLAVDGLQWPGAVRTDEIWVAFGLPRHKLAESD